MLFRTLSLSLWLSVQGSRESGELLCQKVNEYRAENGLSAISYSTVLFEVAEAHIDNFIYSKNNGWPPEDDNTCNLHTWYEEPNEWFSHCCYTDDHAAAECVWKKPKEFTDAHSGMASFSGSGYENAAWGQNSEEEAVDAWKGSSGHNDLMLQQGTFAGKNWLSMGCGSDLANEYYFLWVSDTSDPNGYGPTSPPVPTPRPTPRPTNRPTTSAEAGSLSCSQSAPCSVTIMVTYTLLNSGYMNSAYYAVRDATTDIAYQAWTTGSLGRSARYGSTYTRYTVSMSEEANIRHFHDLALDVAGYQNPLKSSLTAYCSSSSISIDVQNIQSGGAAQEADDESGKGKNKDDDNDKVKWWVWFLVILAAFFVGSACTFGFMVWRARNSGQKWGTQGANYQQMTDFN